MTETITLINHRRDDGILKYFENSIWAKFFRSTVLDKFDEKYDIPLYYKKRASAKRKGNK